jgi:hypothetical protein
MRAIPFESLKDQVMVPIVGSYTLIHGVLQVTVSYGTWTIKKGDERVTVQNRMEFPDPVFTPEEDPTRFE